MRYIENIEARLSSDQFDEPYDLINEIINDGIIISNDELRLFLNHEDNLITSDFIGKYDLFNPEQIKLMESYIIKNLNHEDDLFVSDLIDFANKWQILSIYEECIKILSRSEAEHSVFSSIFFLYERINYEFIEEFYGGLNRIIDSQDYYQNAQVAACFYLFRLSHDVKYLDDLKDYIQNGQDMNVDVLKNILSLNYNQQEYFCYHDNIIQWL
ncbi:hypothetical protein LVD17_21030 [Fulvivirga ulvae]|uniref:hypothetical protein n=1 Tax=Fulvivirga ulvae TaxID=2904245 RepID=UPI001F22B26C|nr:hypothetical protein [Fulvivirga ulvae]UII30781.1 hypothetical protein LVD17_21030 [Fulvivirga ulvae]